MKITAPGGTTASRLAMIGAVMDAPPVAAPVLIIEDDPKDAEVVSVPDACGRSPEPDLDPVFEGLPAVAVHRPPAPAAAMTTGRRS